MKTERAIELLHRLQDEQFDGEYGDERREALEMAVRVLEGDGDMISRQAVMKEFSDFVRKSNNSDFAQTPTWNDAVSLVGSMPSAQPERKMGKWITYRYLRENWNECECDQCHKYAKVASNFCPNCGADMRGDTDG